jgi:hypothetical protein
MKSAEDRIAEFVRYHNKGDGECNNVILKHLCEKKRLSFEERCDLAYFFSLSYSVVSALVIMNNIRKKTPEEIKKDIIFQSDRKYVKMEDRFERSLGFYYKELKYRWRNFVKANSKDGKLDLSKAVKNVQNWYYFGRFSAFLFLETLAYVNDIEVINSTIDWKNGSTATSGLLDVFSYDEEAVNFDKTKKLPRYLTTHDMDNMLEKVQEKIRNDGGDDNTTMVETSLCAYRKFIKGSRYNGYYLDRMLEELVAMENKFPDECTEIYEARGKEYDKKYLGEIMGWKGIRREMKKYYIENGEVNW